MKPHDHSTDKSDLTGRTADMNTIQPESQPPSGGHGKKTTIERKLKMLAGTVVTVLVIGFFVVHFIKSADQRNLANATLKEASAPPLVEAVTVHNAPSSLALTLPGETAAWYQSTIYARVDGYVAQWSSDIGDHVRKGQILATIETPDLDAQLAAAQAKVKASQASVAAWQADAVFARTTYDRWKNSPKGVVSEQERDAKKAGYESSIAKLTEAQAQVGLDQANVDRYTILAQFKQVTAPYDGIITERRIDIGNLVTAGSTSNTTPLYQISQDNPLRIFIDVPQGVAGDIKVGSPAQIKGPQDQIFNGQVTRTANSINPQTRTLRVEVDIPNADHTLVPGMYVNVDFQISTNGLMQVPAAALIFRLSGPQVALIDKNNRIAFRKVMIVRDNGNTLEIGSGVSAGDRVALNISNQIVEGEVVEAHEFKDGGAIAKTPKQ